MSDDLPKTRIFCNRYKNETNHFLKSDHDITWHEEENGRPIHWEQEISRFWICAGCEKAVLEESYTAAGMCTEQDGQLFSSSYYPERRQDIIAQKYFIKLPLKLKDLYQETISAYNSNLHLLCASGLRALLEGICVDKNIKGNNLENKINNLNSILPENIVSNLHSFRFMGNDAVHQLESPTRQELQLAIDVSEDLLNFFTVVP